ncbi:hypothetical protein [Caballeronia novacaledonica]|uniref:Uncharacterized protein n=1 Tax=Caballeronia novacaledonica TaxID=1544861 RepID=A0AA37MTV6_9BURK|nr:hypothetical protein [Caballeronia novacaledonica]GJH28154.1 hypothetical protein CBA19CS42_26580 [Caballeronia novacaledonica]
MDGFDYGLYVDTVIGAAAMYVFSLYHGFEGSVAFLRKMFPNRSNTFYDRCDFIVVTILGSVLGFKLLDPQHPPQAVMAGLGWVSAVTVVMNSIRPRAGKPLDSQRLTEEPNDGIDRVQAPEDEPAASQHPSDQPNEGTDSVAATEYEPPESQHLTEEPDERIDTAKPTEDEPPESKTESEATAAAPKSKSKSKPKPASKAGAKPASKHITEGTNEEINAVKPTIHGRPKPKPAPAPAPANREKDKVKGAAKPEKSPDIVIEPKNPSASNEDR